jgi:hypothetical protein
VAAVPGQESRSSIIISVLTNTLTDEHIDGIAATLDDVRSRALRDLTVV